MQDRCGVPTTIWNTNGDGIDNKGTPPTLDNGVTDYFYQYGPMYGTATGYYGYKVLAVGYGGTLQLYGKKGTTAAAAADKDAANSGSSWVRLAGDLKAAASKAGSTALTLDRSVEGDWQPGDKIVVTTTDYLPSHSEELTISPAKDT